MRWKIVCNKLFYIRIDDFLMVWNIILLGGTLEKRGGRSATTSSVP